LTDKPDLKEQKLDSFSAIESDDVIVVCKPDSGCDVSISLGAETIREIEKLERYAILAGHRIGEFRVG